MLLLVLTVTLIAGCASTHHDFVFHDGVCPVVQPSTGFQPSQIFGDWFVIAHTDAGLTESGCCKCVKVSYEEGTEQMILSHRKAFKFTGEEQNTNSRFVFESEGKYQYQIEEGGEFKPTHMLTTFHYNQDGFLVVYGCTPKDGKHAHVALILSRNQNAAKPAFASGYLEGTGLTHFFDVTQENC